jgi:hypothetical protein
VVLVVGATAARLHFAFDSAAVVCCWFHILYDALTILVDCYELSIGVDSFVGVFHCVDLF